MQVLVLFFTVLREVTGKKEEGIVLQGNEKTTISVVLKQLSEHYGKRFAEYVLDQNSGVVKSYLQFFINGQSATALNGMETVLAEGDVLAIVPPVGGG